MIRNYLSLLLVLFSMQLFAQDSNSEFKEVNKRKDWSVVLSPYAWLAGNSTDVGGERIRQSFNDLSSLTNFGFQMNAMIRYKRLYLVVDGTFAHLNAGMEGDVLNVDANIVQWIIDNKIGYIIWDEIDYSDDNVIAGWNISANIGAKYWLNDINIDYSVSVLGNPIIEDRIVEKQQWWDLMLGVKSNIVLSKYVLLSLSGNIGGFGIGNSSKLAWDFAYTNTFKVSDLLLVSAGYRNIRYNRIDGEGENELTTSVNVYGPFIGVSFAL